MKEKYIIGCKPTRKTVLVTALLSIPLALIFSSFLANGLMMKAHIGMFFLLIWSLILLFYIPTFTTSSKFIAYNKEYMEYFTTLNFLDELKYAWSIVLGKEDVNLMKIKLNNIEKMDISWTAKRGFWALYSHSIMLGITGKDHTVISLEGVYKDKQELIDLVDRLNEWYNIEINDPYRLLDVLRNPEGKIYEYIEILRSNGEEVK